MQKELFIVKDRCNQLSMQLEKEKERSCNLNQRIGALEYELTKKKVSKLSWTLVLCCANLALDWQCHFVLDIDNFIFFKYYQHLTIDCKVHLTSYNFYPLHDKHLQHIFCRTQTFVLIFCLKTNFKHPSLKYQPLLCFLYEKLYLFTLIGEFLFYNKHDTVDVLIYS